MPEPTIWGIHAGSYGEADDLFLTKGVVAMGWIEMGDLSPLGSRDDFKAAYQRLHPDYSTMKVASNAGLLYRLVREMAVDDLIAYPSQWDREVHVGRVGGDYLHVAGEAHYPHQRKVTWVKSIPRTAFSQGALYEMGSAMTLFQIRSYAEEITGALEQTVPTLIAEEQETQGFVAEDIEQQTRDFVLKQLAHRLKGHPFAEFVAHLLQAMGYKTRISPPGPDHQVDIIASHDDLGFASPIVKVEVKSGDAKEGESVVSALYGRVSAGEFGLVVSLGGFSSQARAFERTTGNLRLIDGNELVDLIYKHYDKLDPRYKGVIPLKQLYVPESVD